MDRPKDSRVPTDAESMPKEVIVEAGHISIAELIHLCNEAVRDLEEHRMLIYNCASALSQLSEQLAERDAKIAKLERVTLQ